MRLLNKSINKLLEKFDYKRKVIYPFLTLILLITFPSCGSQKKLDIETLSKVYVDLLVAEDFYSGTDSLKIKKDEIFKKYETDSASYFETYRSLQFDDEKWNEFFNLSQTYLDTLKAMREK